MDGVRSAEEPSRARQRAARRALLPLGVLVALTYLASGLVGTSVIVESGWKAAGIVLFAAYAFWRGAPVAGAALLFGAGGDIALALRPPVFVAGIGLFGVGHTLYIAGFLLRIRSNGAARKRCWIAALIVIGSVALGVWNAPDMGAFLAPGLAYQALLTAMVVCAFLAPVSVIAGMGALSFMISDSMIGLELYKHIGNPPGAIWITYVAGQAMLAYALSDRRYFAGLMK